MFDFTDKVALVTGSSRGIGRAIARELVKAGAKVAVHIREDLAGLDVSPEELALDVIEAVGPRGHFLKLKHTRRNMRKIGYPELTAHPTPDGGYRDPIEVAREKTDWILENHHPEPLDQAQQEEFERILQAAERELG